MSAHFKNEHNLPLITVYIPTYNRVSLLQRAVESVLNQDYKNIELIIVDDQSSDTTGEYLAELVKKDTRVQYHVNSKNSGACVSRNKAIFAAKGKFITGLDDDDYFLPNHISSFWEKWNTKKPRTVALYADIKRKTSTGIIPAYRKIKQCKAAYLIHSNWFGNQAFTKTEYLVQSGGFDPRFPAWQDLDCWYSLLKNIDGEAECTGVYSYVLDISHPHERISTKDIDTIKSAYELFCEKHGLSADERDIAGFMLAHYSKKPPSICSAFKKLYSFLSWYNFRHTLLLYYICLLD